MNKIDADADEERKSIAAFGSGASRVSRLQTNGFPLNFPPFRSPFVKRRVAALRNWNMARQIFIRKIYSAGPGSSISRYLSFGTASLGSRVKQMDVRRVGKKRDLEMH